MRKALVTAVAVAPLLAAMASTAAIAACPTAGTTTSTAGNIDVPISCTVTPAANGSGVVLNSDNTVTVDSGATISNTDKDDSVGILIDASQGNLTGSVSDSGAITLSMSYAATDHNNDGIVDGAWATGTGRYGIRLIGPDSFTGNITTVSGAAITVDGNDSFGISLETTVNGEVVDAGSIGVVGNQTVGFNIAGAVNGNVSISGAIAVTGAGAQGVVTSAPISGQLAISNAVTSTGYRETTAPTNLTTLSDMTADEVEQGGSGLVVGGNVGAGIAIAASTTTGTGTAAVTTTAGSVTTLGSAPAVVIGASGQAITIGNNASTPYGLVVGGTVSAEGLYELKTTPNLGGPVSATAIQLGDGGSVDLSGGVHVTGTVNASALDATAIAIEVGSGTSAGAIVNDGTIDASVTADAQGSVVGGIIIDPGGNVGTITNTGTIGATITASLSSSQTAVAIEDASGNLTAIHNTGVIEAALFPTENSFVITGPTIAIDVANSLNGVAITQTQPTTFAGVAGPQFTGAISGTTLTVSAVTSGNLVVGQTLYGPGIVAGTTITGEVTGTGGTGTYTISTSQTVSSEVLSGASGLPSIVGDVIYGASTVGTPNVFDIESGSMKGALSEAKIEDSGGNIVGTDRNFDVTINNATVDITKAELHQVTTLNVGSTGVLVASVDPSFAEGGSDPTPIFDTTVRTVNGNLQGGVDGTATFANGAQIGISLDALQTQETATYEFVHTSGPGALTVGNLDQTLLKDAPFLYNAVSSVSPDGANLDVTVSLKTPQELGLNASGAAAFQAVFAALQKDGNLAGALIAPTTQAGFLTLYNQMLPDQGIGIFDALESATQKISDLTGQTPDAGTRIGGSSAWLQEVNDTVKRNDGDTIGSTDKVFGLVGGLEKMGAGGGALGVTVSYLNVQDSGVFEPIDGRLVTNMVELGGYYRRAWGNLRVSARAAAGYSWFDEDRMFVTTGVSESSKGEWNGWFGDAHAGAAYEVHFGRFYMRPELSADFLYLNEDAHSESGAGPGFDLSINQRVSDRMTGAAIMTIGAQFGHDAWFRPEIFGGYRETFFSSLASTTAQFTGGNPFTLLPDDGKGGWLTAGFALKAGTPLSYVAIVGEADLRNSEQAYDIYLSGRAMF